MQGEETRSGTEKGFSTTCKAVTLPGDQRIIACSIIFLFPKHGNVNMSQIKYFRSEKRTTSNIMHLYFSRISYTKTQRLTENSLLQKKEKGGSANAESNESFSGKT